jgi:hypothetical protein
MPKKKENTEHINELLHKGPKIKAVKTYGDLVRNLEALKVDPKRAMRLINDNLNKSKDGNTRFNWKMMRFTLYIWARVQEHKTLVMKPKIDTVRELVSTPKYKRLWETFPQSNPFSHQREVKNLAQLIAEPRQQIYFKSSNFLYEGTKKNIPQDIIDKIK